MYFPNQLTEKASTASASGSGFQETNRPICLFSLEANISISGVPKTSTAHENMEGSSFHSILSLKCLELKSASFSIPGTCVADNQIFFSMLHNQHSLARAFNVSIFPPIFWMYEIKYILFFDILPCKNNSWLH